MKLVLKIYTSVITSTLKIKVMKKGLFIAIAKVIVKYVLPILLGYFEGDTHIVQDSVSSIF